MGKDGRVAQRIRANSVLPAHREDIELHTADGLTLVGELARPLDRDPVATLICLHPLPTHGGMMDRLDSVLFVSVLIYLYQSLMW